MRALMDSYEKKYGHAAKIFLRTLGGDPNPIAEEVEKSHSEPDPFGFDFGETDPEDDLHNLIRREILRLYFSKISRKEALMVCNVLGDLGKINPCPSIPELSYNAMSFIDAWNTVNIDQSPIQLDGEDWFSV